ncbi:MAG: 5-dehydro-4-deoxy-D-glucuronate isomerase [Chitinophagaceae bacterium]|nr:MAG: 5-dehydro-4-deoxy-D-glucuronate isomerase [Chitinophagaceae bacterium]
MKFIHAVHPRDFRQYNTEQIREQFLLDNLTVPGDQRSVYTHYDRMIVGAAVPTTTPLPLEADAELRADYFLERREIGIVCIAGKGSVEADGETFSMEKLDCLYLGKGLRDVRFLSDDADAPARFIYFSAPAHHSYPARLMRPAEALPAELGSADTSNHRVINKYIHADGIQSCQLVLGVTNFEKGSIWNTMPPHTHGRRMEAYFYFDLPEDQRIVHLMGEPDETRHLILRNEEGILSPPWSIHSGVGTASYSFIWAMAGENKAFTDMDPAPLQDLR